MTDPFRADFEIIGVTEDRVFLVDLNRGNRSVTNDAENVVARVAALHGPDKRIVYCDSTGRWDELAHERGRFTGFTPYREPLPNRFERP